MVNNGDVQIEKPSDCLVAHIVSPVQLVFSHWARSTLSGTAQNGQCMTSKYPRVIREQMDPMLPNGSRGTLMSYTDHSVQRRLKSNAPTDWISQRCLVFT